jgi:hypothetical protein
MLGLKIFSKDQAQGLPEEINRGYRLNHLCGPRPRLARRENLRNTRKGSFVLGAGFSSPSELSLIFVPVGGDCDFASTHLFLILSRVFLTSN